MHLNDTIIAKIGSYSTKGRFEVRNREGHRVILNGLESWKNEKNLRESARRGLWQFVHDTAEYKYLKSSTDFDRIGAELIAELFSSGEFTIHQIK